MLQGLNDKLVAYEHFDKNFSELKNAFSDDKKILLIAKVWIPLLYATNISIYLGVNSTTLSSNIGEHLIYFFLITALYFLLHLLFKSKKVAQYIGLNFIIEQQEKFHHSWYTKCRTEQIAIHNFFLDTKRKEPKNTLLVEIFIEDFLLNTKSSIDTIRIMSYEIINKGRLLALIKLMRSNLEKLQSYMDKDTFNMYNNSLKTSANELELLGTES